jgi:hypothetical protein
MAKTIRVEIESEDGKIIRLTGDEAEKWARACEATGFMSATHDMPFPTMNWKTFNEESQDTSTRKLQGV